MLILHGFIGMPDMLIHDESSAFVEIWQIPTICGLFDMPEEGWDDAVSAPGGGSGSEFHHMLALMVIAWGDRPNALSSVNGPLTH